MRTLVMKFGGSAVGTTAALNQLASIVLYERERWQRLLIVVSALDGVTDALIEASHLAQIAQQRGYRRIVANLRRRHLSLAENLTLGPAERQSLLSTIDSLLYDMLDLCESLSEQPQKRQHDAIDAIIGVGERLAARIVAALLKQNGLRSVPLDSTDFIITDNVYGNATPNMELTRERIDTQLLPLLDRGILPVITGFIGATTTGAPTTLGRGGSDYTASILGVCARADEVWLWTDVDGLMSADPLEIPDARSISTLSYAEAAEMAYFGARVLHSRMIGPLREQGVPLRVRNVFLPQAPGTRIQAESGYTTPMLYAVTSIPGIGLSAHSSGSLASITALVDDVFLANSGSHAELMITAQSAQHSFVCFVVPTTAGPDAAHHLTAKLRDLLQTIPQSLAWQVAPVTVVTTIGSRLGAAHDWSAQILQALNGIRLLATGYSTERSGLSVVVEPRDAESALRALHEMVLKSALGNGQAPTP